jgi:hypothetical protein
MPFINRARTAAFKRLFAIFFCVFTVIVVVPELINFYVGWLDPVPDKEKLLRFVWITPSVSFIGALFCALFAKN